MVDEADRMLDMGFHHDIGEKGKRDRERVKEMRRIINIIIIVVYCSSI